jgi:hypothetical protein
MCITTIKKTFRIIFFRDAWVYDFYIRFSAYQKSKLQSPNTPTLLLLKHVIRVKIIFPKTGIKKPLIVFLHFRYCFSGTLWKNGLF